MSPDDESSSFSLPEEYFRNEYGFGTSSLDSAQITKPIKPKKLLRRFKGKSATGFVYLEVFPLSTHGQLRITQSNHIETFQSALESAHNGDIVVLSHPVKGKNINEPGYLKPHFYVFDNGRLSPRLSPTNFRSKKLSSL